MPLENLILFRIEVIALETFGKGYRLLSSSLSEFFSPKSHPVFLFENHLSVICLPLILIDFRVYPWSWNTIIFIVNEAKIKKKKAIELQRFLSTRQ